MVGGIKRAAGIVAINAVIALVLCEIAGLCLYYSGNTGFFYFRERPPRPEIATRASSRVMMHPYLGTVGRPGQALTESQKSDFDRLTRGGKSETSSPPEWLSLRLNNMGFADAHDYPWIAEENDYVIGVFGGSVGHWFALQGAADLRQHLSDAVNGRRIVVLNCGQSGWKQPQQAQALMYLLSIGQRFDAVVHISGLNEVAMAGRIDQFGYAADVPSQTVNVTLAMTGDIEPPDAPLVQWRRDCANTGTTFLLRTLQLAAVRKADARREATVRHRSELSADSMVLVNPDGPDMWEVWLHASAAMADLCRARGILYLEVVQPNQYASGHVFSDEEGAVALSDSSPYKGWVEAGYPRMPEQIKRLKEAGVDVESGLDIFDDVSAPTYADDCCHYNQMGNEVLAIHVAGWIEDRLAHR